MSEITFQYPSWFIIFCALLGLAYAAMLYFRDGTFRENAPNLSKLLGGLRFLTVTGIAILLLAPLIKSLLTETRKPVVILAQDESESVGNALSGEALAAYRSKFDQVASDLSEKFEVQRVGFGDGFRDSIGFGFGDKVTNLSEFLQGVYDQYSGQNLGAVVMASDGIFNEGSNPIYASTPLAVPVYTVALGDTTPRRDLMVKRVFHNKIAYLGDKFVLQVDVAASNCSGASSTLTIQKIQEGQNKTLQSIPIVVQGNDFFTTKDITLEADQAGVARYLITLTKVQGEATTVNNSREIFIDVLDARQKILLLAGAPHPDISALRQMLDLNKNYQLEVAYANKLAVDVAKYDFVILHNLPSLRHSITNVLATLNNRRIPRLFIAGPQANLSAINEAQNLINIKSTGNQTDEVTATLARNFSAFILDAKIGDQLPNYAPAVAPFGTFSATPQAQVILNKRVGKVDTDEPLLAVGENNGIKTGILMCDGFWKWRLFNFLQNQDAALFDELFGKTVQYLTIKEDKRKFRVETEKSVINENESVLFNAELYNDNYELINDPDVSLVIKNSEGREFPYTFNKQERAYSLDAGLFPTGSYTYRASTAHNGQNLTFDGKFSVRPIEMELFESTANHGVLRALAQKTGGEMVFPDSLASLSQKLLNSAGIKPVIYQTTQTDPVINLKWIFALLALLLALEWFLRRYFGSY